MATQTTHMIDVTRSYVPVDPNAFPNNLMFSQGDSPETAKQIVPFEGYNFLPTSYGYKSYFGITSKLDIFAIPSRVDYIIILQSNTFVNKAVALCEDGIWTKEANSSGAWAHDIILSIPAVGVHYDWSYCFIDNDFFCYRAGDNGYYRYSSIPRTVTAGEIAGALPTVIDPSTIHTANIFFKVIPTFLNMTGQMGIFKAGSRLGFWDSANSISWSSIDDYAEFTPAVLTQAGSAIFLEVQGRIVNILSNGDGFVVYATKSITFVARDESSTMQWNPQVLLKDAGIAFKRECCGGGGDGTLQFANTSIGLIKVENNKATTIVEEVSDFLKESAEPIFLTLIGGRYLFLEILDSNYIDGLVHFTVETLPSTAINFPPSNIAYNNEKTDTINGVFSGTNSEIQSKIDAYLATNGLPARKVGTTYAPIVNSYLNDHHIVQPLTEALPVVAPDTFSIVDPYTGNTVQSYLGGVGGSAYEINTSVISNDGVISKTTIESGFSGNASSSFTVLPGQDNSGASTITDIIALYFAQVAKWQANDKEVNDLMTYIMLYESTSFLGSSIANEKGDTETQRAQWYSYSPFPTILLNESSTSFAYPNETHVPGISGGNYYTPFPSSNTYIGDSFTVDSSWTFPTLSMVNNTVTISRERYTVSTVYSSVDVSIEQVPYNQVTNRSIDYMIATYGGSVASWPSWTDQPNETQYIARGRANPFAFAGITEGTPGNPVQQATATITGFNYTGADNLPHQVNWDNSFALADITPFYYNTGGTVILPSTSFLLQDGSIGPVYPTIPGALVYDLQLKKWGKMKQEYKVLVDWSPLNNLSGNTIPYEVFGMEGGILQTDGKIALFDKYPVDSYIKYGKIGYHRQGMTSAEEVRISFRELGTGTIRTEASLDNTSVELGLTKTSTFTNARDIVMYPSTVGRWHTVSIIGIYDIKHLEFRGTKVGNR